MWWLYQMACLSLSNGGQMPLYWLIGPFPLYLLITLYLIPISLNFYNHTRKRLKKFYSTKIVVGLTCWKGLGQLDCIRSTVGRSMLDNMGWWYKIKHFSTYWALIKVFRWKSSFFEPPIPLNKTKIENIIRSKMKVKKFNDKEVMLDFPCIFPNR